MFWDFAFFGVVVDANIDLSNEHENNLVYICQLFANLLHIFKVLSKQAVFISYD